MSAIYSTADTVAGTGACLHLLMSATADTVQSCLEYAVEGDSIVLLDQGAGLLLRQDWTRELADGVSLFVLQADADARGLSGLLEPGQGIDDLRWAELVSRYPHCLSWK